MPCKLEVAGRPGTFQHLMCSFECQPGTASGSGNIAVMENIPRFKAPEISAGEGIEGVRKQDF